MSGRAPAYKSRHALGTLTRSGSFSLEPGLALSQLLGLWVGQRAGTPAVEAALGGQGDPPSLVMTGRPPGLRSLQSPRLPREGCALPAEPAPALSQDGPSHVAAGPAGVPGVPAQGQLPVTFYFYTETSSLSVRAEESKHLTELDL